jgi:hypothetical protein
MPAFICTACGTQYASTEAPPALCTICQEERQYVPPGGQSWSTLEALASSHFNSWRQHEPGILGIGTVPHFAIGQRAILVCTPRGNVLWDCISLIDDATVSLIKGLGGVQAIAISHPHFYTSMAEWSRALDAPIHLHAADRDWIMRPDPAVRLWEGDTLALLPDITLIRAGGHFPGGTVLHWANGAEGRGVVCSGDILTVTTDRKFLSFMRSYPNLIPLGPPQIAGIAQAMEPFRYDRIYGHYFDRVIPQDAKEVMRVSVARYLAAISGERYHKG